MNLQMINALRFRAKKSGKLKVGIVVHEYKIEIWQNYMS